MTVNDHLKQHRPRYNTMLDVLELESASRLLDVGVDPFIFTELLTERVPEDVELLGVSYGELGEPTQKRDIDGRIITVKHCNVERDRWPFDDNAVDRLVLGAIIEHLFDPLEMLSEARRVLSSDGVLVLSTPNAVRLVKRVEMILGRNPFDGYALESRYNRHNHEWTHRELLDILDVAGFDIVEEQFPVLNRTGISRIIQSASHVHPSLSDQLVVQCRPGEPNDRVPEVYREGLIEDVDQ